MLGFDAWRVVCEDPVVYEFPVDHISYFETLIHIWQNNCQSLNRRLSGTLVIGKESDDFANVLNALPTDLSYQIQAGTLSFELRKMIGRTTIFSLKCYELSYDASCTSDEMAVVFYPVQLDPSGSNIKPSHIPFPYRISCKIVDEVSLRFTLSVPSSVPDGDCRWLLRTAYPGLLNWMKRVTPGRVSQPTNRLLNIELYSETYRRLKEERGREIVAKWAERTDPQKFVFEDCGIVTYLLETWRRLGRQPKCFADLGCGNGLLVHLLNAEGVKGIGLDIRSRKIWQDMFSTTDLREVSIDPTAHPTGVPSGVDYLIGNHSDELTPWIPVIAARLNCEFILIPCCPFDFHGKYTSRPGDGGSAYEGFLHFVMDVCTSLGYIVEMDRLSIPSTKRVCYVCTIPPNGLPINIEEIIQRLTKQRPGNQSRPFAARPAVTAVRNCTNIKMDDRIRLTSMFFERLLSADPAIRCGWRCGGELELSELMKLLSDDDKLLLKQQNGGLQTFLKNQHQVFQVVQNGRVRIRDWRDYVRATPRKVQTSPCWMMANHPDGCSSVDDCSFKH